MVPTATLPVAAAAPPATNGAASANGGAGGSSDGKASQDFLLMLGQLIAAPEAVPASAPLPPRMVVPEIEKDATDALDAAALEAMLPFSLATPANVPQAAGLPGQGGDAAADILDIAAVSADGLAKTARPMLEALPEALTETETSEPGDATLFANLNGATSVPLDEASKARAAASSDPGRGLHTPVGSSEWADELGTRLTLMAERGHHTASLRLSPEHLGPLEIRISVRDDQASVWFGAAHADTRAAIEQALPRLRELFGTQGLTLADAGVSHEPPRDQPRPQDSPNLGGNGTSTAEPEGTVITIAHRRLGLVDAYA